MYCKKQEGGDNGAPALPTGGSVPVPVSAPTPGSNSILNLGRSGDGGASLPISTPTPVVPTNFENPMSLPEPIYEPPTPMIPSIPETIYEPPT